MHASRRLRAAQGIAAGLVATTFVLLVFGSTVRIHDAGLACPDWPMCFGQVVPVIDFGVALEFGHRVLAGLVSLVFVGLAGLVLSVRSLRRALWPWLAVAAVVLATQIVLGGLTVLELLDEWTVTSHLVAGNTFCALLFVIALQLFERGRTVERAGLSTAQRVASVVVLVAVFVQLGLGGFVASSHAGLACGPTWPGCGGSAWFPTFSDLVGLQVIHRIGAYVVVALAIGAALFMRRQGRAARAARWVVVVVLAQATLGILNVWLAMPAEITAAHSAGAALLVLTAARACYEALRAPAAVHRSVPLAASLEAR